MKYLLFLAVLLIASCQQQTPSLSGLTLDGRDNITYQTVDICGKIWMTENMRYELPGSVTDVANPETYGRYYRADQIHAVCPDGWHIPSDAEWSQLEICLGMSVMDTSVIGINKPRGQIASNLKSSTDWKTNSGNNSSDMNIYPTGWKYSATGPTDNLLEGSLYYTSTSHPTSTNNIIVRVLLDTSNHIYRGYQPSTYYAPCRCVKD